MTLFHDNRELLEAFRRGDAHALETVYWHYVDRVTDAVRRGVFLINGGRVSGVPAHDVIDRVQEVFVRAFAARARDSYDGLRDYQPYLMTICRNLLADWARKRDREVPSDTVLESLDEAPATEPEPWADPGVMAAVDHYVATLEEPLASVYEQRFRQGLSQAKAAEALGIGRQRLRTLENRIRAGLATALAQD